MRPIDGFAAAADAHPDRIALRDGDVSLSFAELSRLSDAIASGLSARLSPAREARIALIAPNDYRVVACTLGVMRVGAVFAPVHVTDAIEKKIEYLTGLQPACAIYHSSIAAEIGALKDVLPTTQWVCLDGPSGPDPSLDQLTSGPRAAVEDWGDVYGSLEHPVCIRQTSGTTGKPKLVVSAVRSFNETIRLLRQGLHDSKGAPVCLVAAPLSHAAGMHAFAMLTLGATLVILATLEPAVVLDHLERHHVTHLWLPPTALYLLLSWPDARACDYSSLRSLVLGAAAVAPARLKEAVEVFGPCLCQSYSQIESGFLTWLDAGTIAAAAAGDHPERLMTSGKRLAASRVEIVDEDGRVLGAGGHGEIVVRGPSVKRYLDPEETRRAQEGGWHHTGDLGYFDQDGYLFVTGRKKDNIITGGLKVSAAEVEQVIMEIAAVGECAVIAAPDEIRGEAVTAIVTVKADQSVSNETILAHCRSRLGRAKAPRSVQQWPQLPKSAVGKIDKQRIRDSFWPARPSAWGYRDEHQRD